MCCCLLSPPPQPSSALLLRHFWCLVFEGWDTNCLLPQDQVANPIAYPRRCCQSQYPVTARWEECCCRQYTQASGWLLWYRVFRTTSFRSLECNCPNETVQESSLSSLPAMCAVLSNFNKLSEIQVSHLKKKRKEHLSVFHWVIVKVKGMKYWHQANLATGTWSMLVIFVTISFRFGIRHGTEQPCLF